MKLFINAYFHSENMRQGDFVKQEEEHGLLMMEREIFTLAYFFSSKGTIFQFAIYILASPF